MLRTCASWWYTDHKMSGLCSGDPRQRKAQAGNEGDNHGQDVVLFVSKVNTNGHRKTWGLASKTKREIKTRGIKRALWDAWCRCTHRAMVPKYRAVTGTKAESEELGNRK